MQLLDFQLQGKKFQNGRLYASAGNLGLGLFAGSAIREDERILLFKGNVISFKEAVAKGDRECWSLQFDLDKYIDLEIPGCLANHSCEPNSGVRDGGNAAEIELVALREIAPGEEILFDYSTTMDEDYYTMVCRCGSKNCRKIVTDFKMLPELAKRHYLRLGIVMDFISRQYHVSA